VRYLKDCLPLPSLGIQNAHDRLDDITQGDDVASRIRSRKSALHNGAPGI